LIEEDNLKSVIVTGTTSGLGNRLQNILLSKDVNLFVLNRKTNLEPVASISKARVKYLYCDLAQLSVSNFIFPASVFEEVSEVVFVMNAATILPLVRVDELEIDDLRKTFEVNYFSYVMLTQVLLKMCEERGLVLRVIFVSTGAVNRPISGWSAYSTSKGALLSFCQHVALENDNLELLIFDPGIFESNIQKEISLFNSGSSENQIQSHFSDVGEIANRLCALILLGDQ
jgi:benzil reductase ((S)-benzoin forming)